MTLSTYPEQDTLFLQNGGVATTLLLAKDWAKTSLGMPGDWPFALKQALAMILGNACPAFVCWGDDHLFFFNEAFLLQCTGKVATLDVGLPAEKVFANDWELAGTALNLAIKGKQTGIEVIGASLSKVTDTESGSCGVWGICNPGTTFYSEKAHEQSEMVASAPFPIAVYVGREMRITQANQAVIDVWGKGSDVIGKTYMEILPELEDQSIYVQLEQVYDTGIPFHARNQRVDLTMRGKLETFYFNYSFTPLYDRDGRIYGVMNTAADVTDLVMAKQQVERNEEDFRNMIRQAPVAMCLLLGSSFKVALANASMLDIWGRRASEVMDKPVFDVLPDTWDSELEEALSNVFYTGKVFQAVERPLLFTRGEITTQHYLNFVCQAYWGTKGDILGMFCTAVDVTPQVEARKELKRVYEQTSLAKEAAQLGTFDMDLKTGALQWDKRCRELFGAPQEGEITYEQHFQEGVHPDDIESVEKAIDRAVNDRDAEGEFDEIYRIIPATTQKLVWIRAKGKVYFNERHEGSRFIGTVLDVTDQQTAELKNQEIAEKQARLAALVDSSDDVIISKQLDGTITSWNAAAERMFGYTPSEAIGQHISLIIPFNRMGEEEYIISKIRKGFKIDHFDTVRIAKDGGQRQLSITVSPIIDDNGKVIGASKIARDISLQVEAREATFQYTTRLEILNMIIKTIAEELDVNSILQKVTDASAELTRAEFGAFFLCKEEDNQSIELLTLSANTKWRKEDIPLNRGASVFCPAFESAGVMRVDNMSGDAGYGAVNSVFGSAANQLPMLSFLAIPVMATSGKVIGGLLLAHAEPGKFTADHESLVVAIAAQAAIGIDNAMLYKKVKELNDKKDEFIGLASHELKTPLASINGYLQILNRLVKEEGALRFLGKASLQVRKLTTLVNDLLDISKIEAGKLKLTINSFNLSAIIEEAVDLIRNTTDHYEVLLVALPETCMVKGDSQRIEQVVINLLTNAIKYSPGAHRVEVRLICEREHVKVGITDFGMGIAPDKITNLFSRFYRIDEAAPNISGLGIGLYLSHEIITRHQGNIWVNSEPGKGSTFWFSLPL